MNGDDRQGRGERDEAVERLMDVLLEEELAPAPRRSASVGGAVARPPAHAARPPSASDRRYSWVRAAAVLLCGVGVVVAVLALERAGDHRQVAAPQDPAPSPAPRVIEPRDLAHFGELAAGASLVRLVRKEVVGAGQMVTASGVADQLDLVAWPEVHAVQGEAVATWRDAIAAGLGERANRGLGFEHGAIGTVFELDLTLRDGGSVRCFVNLDEAGAFRIEAAAGDGLVASGALHDLLQGAHRRLQRRHRLARGIASSDAELAELPATSERVECPFGCLAGLARFERLRELQLTTGGNGADLGALRACRDLAALDVTGLDVDAATVAALVALPQLRELTLRSCTGLSVAHLRDLSRLRRLDTLRCIDTDFDTASAEAMQTLVAFPALRAFALRAPVFGRAAIEPLVRTRLESLLVVDAPVAGEDLALLAELPTLRELTVVAPIGDADVRRLRALRTLRRLVIRNAEATSAAIDDLRRELPDCAIDWRPNARYFDTLRAFDH